MRLDIYISTDVLSPRPRQGSYHATWIGYGSSGRKVGEDGTFDSAFGNQYGLLVMALREAAEHINQNALSHADDWRFIASKLKGLIYRAERGSDGK